MIDISTRVNTDINKIRARVFLAIAIGFMALLFVAACGNDEKSEPPAAAPAAAVQVAPTTAPVPTTKAPEPTVAPEPTAAPAPTSTPAPTAKPAPTAAPAPTTTPVPTVAAAPTPVSDTASESAPVTEEEALLIRFNDHIENGRLGDWSAFLEGCALGTREAYSPADVASRWRGALSAYELSNEGLNIVNTKVQILDGISALVFGDMANFQEISTYNTQGQSQAWMWAKEGDQWFDMGCSLGGA